MEKECLLKWQNHKHVFSTYYSFMSSGSLTDVTLAVDEGKRVFEAHRVVLAASSPILHARLAAFPTERVVLFFNDIRADEMEALLRFVYLGEMYINEKDCDSLLKAAEVLGLRGLSKAAGAESNTTEEIISEITANQENPPVEPQGITTDSAFSSAFKPVPARKRSRRKQVLRRSGPNLEELTTLKDQNGVVRIDYIADKDQMSSNLLSLPELVSLAETFEPPEIPNLENCITAQIALCTRDFPRTERNCAGCGNSFPDGPSLETHVRAEHPELEVQMELEITSGNTHKCDHCNKSYMYDYNLARHIRTEHAQLATPIRKRKRAGSKPFSCDSCEKGYFSIQGLRRHLSRRHIDGADETEERKTYACEMCVKSYSHKKGLVAHLKNSH